jgi:hypothetical protein
VDSITQAILLLDFLVNALAPLAEADARREIREYLATVRFRRWAQHSFQERGRGAVIARIPRRLKPGRTWRNRYWRPEGHAVTRALEEMRAAKTESGPDVAAINAQAEAAYARATGQACRSENSFFGTKYGRLESLPAHAPYRRGAN